MTYYTITMVSKQSSDPLFAELKTLKKARRRTPLYKQYRYVPPHRVGFLRRFGLKTGINFAHFGLESGKVFEETTGVYERIHRFY